MMGLFHFHRLGELWMFLPSRLEVTILRLTVTWERGEFPGNKETTKVRLCGHYGNILSKQQVLFISGMTSPVLLIRRYGHGYLTLSY